MHDYQACVTQQLCNRCAVSSSLLICCACLQEKLHLDVTNVCYNAYLVYAELWWLQEDDEEKQGPVWGLHVVCVKTTVAHPIVLAMSVQWGEERASAGAVVKPT